MGQERDVNSTGDDLGETEAYTKSRKLWKLYLEGKLTASELAERLGGFREDNKIREIKELFGAEDI